MQELTMNETEQVDGGSAACTALTFGTTVMGGAIGAITGGMMGPEGVGVGGFWGAQAGQGIGLALCSML